MGFIERQNNMKYKVIIEEHVTETFCVEANSVDEALAITAEKYYDCEFVLEPGNISYRGMAIEEPEIREWFDF